MFLCAQLSNFHSKMTQNPGITKTKIYQEDLTMDAQSRVHGIIPTR